MRGTWIRHRIEHCHAGCCCRTIWAYSTCWATFMSGSRIEATFPSRQETKLRRRKLSTSSYPVSIGEEQSIIDRRRCAQRTGFGAHRQTGTQTVVSVSPGLSHNPNPVAIRPECSHRTSHIEAHLFFYAESNCHHWSSKVVNWSKKAFRRSWMPPGFPQQSQRHLG